MNYIENISKLKPINLKIFGYDKIFKREYDNEVYINYSIINNNIIYIHLIESKVKNKGNGSLVFKDFINEFKNHDILLFSVEDKIKWYEKFGLIPQGNFIEGAGIKMFLKRGN